MKQHISVEQIEELLNEPTKLINLFEIMEVTRNQSEIALTLGSIGEKRLIGSLAKELTIGKMIEILGGKLYRLCHYDNNKGWYIEILTNMETGEFKGIHKQGLCDCLWEAVKETLGE